MPFLENVTRGRGVPPERLLEVARHYELFDGVSPINAQKRELIAALEPELRAHGVDLPGVLRQPKLATRFSRHDPADARRRRSGARSRSSPRRFSSYSGCRQYREISSMPSRRSGPNAPEVRVARMFFNHPGSSRRTSSTCGPRSRNCRPARLHIAFTAHSIPVAMAIELRVRAQLAEAARLVAQAVGVADWEVVYQSRRRPAQVPWLEPDISAHLEQVARATFATSSSRRSGRLGSPRSALTT